MTSLRTPVSNVFALVTFLYSLGLKTERGSEQKESGREKRERRGRRRKDEKRIERETDTHRIFFNDIIALSA